MQKPLNATSVKNEMMMLTECTWDVLQGWAKKLIFMINRFFPWLIQNRFSQATNRFFPPILFPKTLNVRLTLI